MSVERYIELIQRFLPAQGRVPGHGVNSTWGRSSCSNPSRLWLLTTTRRTSHD